MANTNMNIETTVTTLASADELVKEHGSKSAAIRWMSSNGHSRSAIANHLGIRYQHVRNVLTQPLKKNQE